jgi:transcriptional regulator with XRE-family HTH domain
MDYSSLGRRILETRLQRELTQLQLSRTLHVSQQHIGNIEKGRAHPSLDLVVDIANDLDVSMDFLLQDSLQRPYVRKNDFAMRDLEQYLALQQYTLSNLLDSLHRP